MKYYCDSQSKGEKITNQREIKLTNVSRVFSLIRYGNDISRAAIAKTTGLTPTTVSALVDELCARGLVLQVGMGESTTGRKPILLKVNPDYLQIPVLALRPTGLLYTLFDLECNELETIFQSFSSIGVYKLPINSDDQRRAASDMLSQMATKLLLHHANRIEWGKVPALCMTLGGTFRWEKGLFSSSVLKMFATTQFVEDIYQAIEKRPIFIENESTSVAYAERCIRYGGMSSFIFINAGNGVGHSYIVNGEIALSEEAGTYDFGHVSIDMNGRPCFCGNIGCVERYICSEAIVNDVVSRIQQGGKSLVSELVGGDLQTVSMDVLRIALEQNDSLVNDALTYVARCLAVGINNLICVREINNIVLGGGIQVLGDRFLEIVRGMVSQVGYRRKMEKVEISYSLLNRNADSLGIVQQYLNMYPPF